MATSIFEMKPRTSHQILDRSRDKHLRGLRLGLDSGGDIDGDATNVIAVELDLSSMETGPDLEVETMSAIANRAGAFYGPRRSVECRHEAISGSLDLPSTEAAELAADHAVVTVEKVVPTPITYRGRGCGGIDDVSEEHR